MRDKYEQNSDSWVVSEGLCEDRQLKRNVSVMKVLAIKTEARSLGDSNKCSDPKLKTDLKKEGQH